MPPRTSSAMTRSAFNLTGLLQSLPASLSRRPTTLTTCSACLFSTTTVNLSKRSKKRAKRRNDPYRAAQALQRKNVNVERQRVLQAQRREAMGDPIRSRPTDFIESLSSATVVTSQTEALNYFLTLPDAEAQLKRSRWLTEPLHKKNDPLHDQQQFERRQGKHAEDHENASRAISAITTLNNASSKDIMRWNIQRCIESFGRHNTDKTLPPKPASAGLSRSRNGATEVELVRSPEDEARVGVAAQLAAIPKRVGRDTGSSEVQISILTAKINVLADNLGKKDKHNKRNLRLLVHRRQKLLNYMRRKERGGSRWQNLVEKLGISDAMWKGEISL